MTPKDLSVMADVNRLQQILFNLVGNALEFTEEGSVTVSAVLQKKWVAITVADTGIGIAEDDLDLIFDGFTQVEGAAERNLGGAGLGLAICQQLVMRHGGKISVDSTLGKGSRFIFTLKQARTGHTIAVQASSFGPTSIPDLVKPTNEPEHKDVRARVLIVDDDSINRQVLVNNLTTMGCRIIQVDDGEQALAHPRNNYDLVLLDIMMPGMSGYEVCRQMRLKNPMLPFYAINPKSSRVLMKNEQFGA